MTLTTPVAASTKIAGVKNASNEEVQSTRLVIGSAGDTPVAAGNPLPVVEAALAALIGVTTPADDAFTISPSDSVDLATTPKALYVTVAGNLAFKGAGGTTITIPVTAGQVLPIRARRVMATNTTAAVIGLV